MVVSTSPLDLSTFDIFLCGNLKSKVFVHEPRSVKDLKEAIWTEIAAIRRENLGKVMQYFEERHFHVLKQARVDIIFGSDSL